MTFVNRPVRPRASPRLQGLRILLVDDEPISLRLVQRLLSNEGAELELAANGQEGVNAVLASLADGGHPLHAVLMDVHMPVMDGYGATTAIRQHFDHAALPIIAMTANDSPADVRACLAAGMNDLVGKPIHLEKLLSCLIQHVPQHADAAEPAPVNLSAQAGADIDADMQVALARMGGKVQIFLDVLESFQRSLALVPAKLAGLLGPGAGAGASQPLAEAVIALHSLKGLARTLGLTALAGCAAAAERALQEPGVELQRALLLTDIESAVQQALQDIAAVLPKLRARARG